MAKFIVIQLTKESEDVGEGEDYEDVRAQPVLCETTREIAAAVQQMRSTPGGDWSVWEVMGGVPVQRAVTFKLDGAVAYDVDLH